MAAPQQDIEEFEYDDDESGDDTLFIEHMASLNIEDSLKYPERILDRLFTLVTAETSRHYERYGEYVQNNRDALKDVMLSALRTPVKDLFAEADGLIQKARASQLGGDISSHGRGIYLHIVRLSDNKVYWYIGQAYNLAFRIRQHNDFRFRREHPSLHNFVMDRSLVDRFIILATLVQPFRRPDLLLNLLEMWCCLLFRCLQQEDLEEWSDGAEAVFDDDVHCANVALPLDNGDEAKSKKALNVLRYAGDDIARDYYDAAKSGQLRPRATTSPKKAVVILAAPVSNIVPQIVEDDKLFVGILLGVVGTVGIFVLRQFFLTRRD